MSVDVITALNAFILIAAASPWLLLVMFAVAAVDAVFPPMPSETVLVAGATAAAASGEWTTVIGLCIAAALGAMLGDNLAYAIGRALGSRRARWLQRPRIAAAFDDAQHALSQRAATLIIGARYIPIGRVAVNITAGALGYPWRRFAPISVIAATTWAVYGAAIGILAGNWLADQPFLAAIIGVLIALVVGIAVDRAAALRRRRREASPTSEAGRDADRIADLDASRHPVRVEG